MTSAIDYRWRVQLHQLHFFIDIKIEEIYMDKQVMLRGALASVIALGVLGLGAKRGGEVDE